MIDASLRRRFISASAKETERLAEKIGRALKGGEVIELVSDLGGGKTTFVRGLMRGLGSEDTVASPTFTVSRLYAAGKLEVHHFDFYRLHEAGIIADELAEVAGDPGAVVVIEWSDIVQHVLPPRRMAITIGPRPDGSRTIELRCDATLQYLLEAAG